jgi:PAS domain S-box-containing protein
MSSQRIVSLCERIVAEMLEAVVFADRDGIIQLWTRGAEALFGYPAAEAVGQSLDIIIPDDLRARHWEGYQTAITTGRTRLGTRALPTRAVRKGGETIYVELSFAVIHDEAEAAIGALAVGRNITERHLKDRELRRRLAELEAGTAARAPAPPAGDVQ